jgi:predicted acyl esterase
MNEIREETVVIPLPQGRWLQARLWRPVGAGRRPAILESSPYRAGDLFRPLADGQLAWFAAHDYAVLAIDIAGSGNSPGLLDDEYETGEIDDLVAAIDWAAQQDWCDGGVGLCGLSWAAFAALRAAARQPPALKAMVLGGVSEDGWRTDVHYMGGVPYTAQVDWAGVMLMLNALPPDPAQFRGDWRAEWIARLRNNRPWLLRWLAHPERDDYWAAKTAPADGTVPLLLYAGLADKYAASVLRIAQSWRGPVRTILGPWEHTPPDIAGRGPRIGFRQEALHWWEAFLKSGDAMRAPRLSLWIGAPDGQGNMTDGGWRACDALPAARMTLQGSGAWQTLPRTMPRSNALTADLYEDAPAPFDLAACREAGALIATSAPATSTVELAGMPQLELTARHEKPTAHVIARLLDVAPDGSAVRIVTRAARLAGQDVTMALPPVGWRLAAGHAVALVLCADGRPTFWQPPHAGMVEVRDIRLTLPVLVDADTMSFEAPLSSPSTGIAALKWLDATQDVPTAPRPNALTHHATGAAHHLMATGTDYHIVSRFEIAPDGDWAAKSCRVAFERPDWRIRIDARLEVSSTPDAFEVRWHVEARDGDTLVHRADETQRIPRTVV